MKRLQCQKGTDEINHGGTKFIVNNYTWQVDVDDEVADALRIYFASKKRTKLMSGPTGMVFQINPTNGNLTAQPSLATPGAPPNDQPYPGDWQLVVTGCPAGSSAQNIAALVYSNAAIPLPLGIGNRPIRFQVAYSALSAGLTKVTPY